MQFEDLVIMLCIHSKQSEIYSEWVLSENKVKFDLKDKIKKLNFASKEFNRIMQMNWGDEYEVSAQVSESMYKMTKLSTDKLNELTNIIDEYVSKNA